MTSEKQGQASQHSLSLENMRSRELPIQIRLRKRRPCGLKNTAKQGKAAEKAKRKFVVFYFPLWMLRTMADGVKLHEIHQGLNLNRLRESLKRFFHVAKLQIGANKYLLLKR